MFCRNCGSKVLDNTSVCTKCGFRPLVGNSFCQNCGAPTAPQQVMCTKCRATLRSAVVPTKNVQQQVSGAKKVIGSVLFVLGILLLILAVVNLAWDFISGEFAYYMMVEPDWYLPQFGGRVLILVVSIFLLVFGSRLKKQSKGKK